MKLSTVRLDRAAGVLVALGCGDALGVPYEFARPPEGEPEMIGGGLGPYHPGEYSDDTQMAVCIAEVAATGADLTASDSLDQIAERFLAWGSTGASDVGIQTRHVLAAARAATGPPAARMAAAARRLHGETGHTAGNGALMRTGIVGLASLGDLDQTAAAARAVAELTHTDPLAGDSCVLWSIGVAVAVADGTFDGVRRGLDYLSAERRDMWAAWLDEAEGADSKQFPNNGFTVTALQAAYAAITATAVPPDRPDSGDFPCLHLQRALSEAVLSGNDTDTVAAIAGALLGARWGVSAVPARWRRIVHGWPELRSRDLARLGIITARGGTSDEQGWPQAPHFEYGTPPRAGVPHPADAEVTLGTANTTGVSPDAVVSLCRLGRCDVPAAGIPPEDHVDFWLIDTTAADNPNLAFVIDDAARTVLDLRSEGKSVLLHCVHAESRTPTVAARYGMLKGRSVWEAKRETAQALGAEARNEVLWAELDRFDGG